MHSVRLLTALLGLLAGGCASNHAPSVQDGAATRLVALSAQRLALSMQVARSKWDTHAPVADPPGDPRESQVLAAVSRAASERGVSPSFAVEFFSDQIEASKWVQYGLLAQWRRGRVPDEPRAELSTELRPALDVLSTRLVDALAGSQTLRARPDCEDRMAAAVADHVQQQHAPALIAYALDRGLARVCAP